MDKIIVIVKLWTDKINGNTYHKVKLIINNTDIITSVVTYGYEKQYKETAYKIFNSKYYGYDKKEFKNNTIFEEIQVSKKELYK